MSGADMSRHFGFKRNTISQWMRNHGMSVPQKLQYKFRSKAMSGRTTMTKKQESFVLANYLTMPIKVIGRKIGKSHTGIMGRLRQLGIKIPKKLRMQRKQMNQLKKGNVPSNKGKKQKDYMSKAQIKKTMATRFKKGHLPHNCIGIKDGDIRIRKISVSRGSRPYKYIRISLGKWKELHVYNWEKKHGSVPEGKIVVFKNGDSMNCSISNLKLITRQQHAANTRNTDGYIAMTMSHETGGRGRFNHELYAKILNNKPLLNIKRKQLQLKRAINESSLQVS